MSLTLVLLLQELYGEELQRSHSVYTVPAWELQAGFAPVGKTEVVHAWVNHRGETIPPSTSVLSAEEVVEEGLDVDLSILPLRDHDHFVPGGIHNCIEAWERLHPSKEVEDWLKGGVGLATLFAPYKGNFKGRT